MRNAQHNNFLSMAENLISVLINKFKYLLDKESIDMIKHYLDHSEYEMAFEGLFIELMNVNAVLTKTEIETYYNLGLKLELDKESVFDSNFWCNFMTYMKHTS